MLESHAKLMEDGLDGMIELCDDKHNLLHNAQFLMVDLGRIVPWPSFVRCDKHLGVTTHVYVH